MLVGARLFQMSRFLLAILAAISELVTMGSKLIAKNLFRGDQRFRRVSGLPTPRAVSAFVGAALRDSAGSDYGVFEQLSLFPRKSRHVLFRKPARGRSPKRASSVFSWRSTHCRTSSGECSVVFSSATNCTFGSRSWPQA